MKHHLLVLATIVLPAIGFGQDEQSTRKMTAVGLTFSPTYSYRTLNFAAGNQWVATMRDKTEIPKTGFTAGLNLRYRLSRRASLETGLSYSDQGYKTKQISLNWVSNDPDLPGASYTVFHYKYLQLPVKVNYKIHSWSRLTFFGSAGMAFNVFLAKTTRVFEGPGHSHASSKFIGNSKISGSTLIGLGLDYRISERLFVRLEPGCQYFLNSIVSDGNAREHLFSLGLNGGIFYIPKNKK